MKYRLAADHASEYATRQGLLLIEQIGSGQDGIVYSTNQKTAVKAFLYHEQYHRERQVYGRIEDCDINSVGEFSIPRLIGSHDELLVIEMEFVSPPFIVDFAGAYLDEPPQYPQELLAEWERERRRLFGSNWPKVRSALSILRGYGIHLSDVKPGNVMFQAES